MYKRQIFYRRKLGLLTFLWGKLLRIGVGQSLQWPDGGAGGGPFVSHAWCVRSAWVVVVRQEQRYIIETVEQRQPYALHYCSPVNLIILMVKVGRSHEEAIPKIRYIIETLRLPMNAHLNKRLGHTWPGSPCIYG